jgi:ATP-dependent Clp protease ATP-binding subunit ClpA
MFERFTKDARRVVTDSESIARELGATRIEAEHLLLAVARAGDPALEAEGLDYDGVLAALEREAERSLAAVGVVADPPPPVTRSAGQLRFSHASKAALEQTLKAAVARRDRRIESRHILLGLLEPARGTVPRALEAAGVDREALRARL